VTMSASFHMRGTTIIETERHRDGSGGYVRLSPDGDSVYPDFCEAGRIWSRFCWGSLGRRR